MNLPIDMDDPNLWPQILSNSSDLLDASTIQAQNTEPTFDITEQATNFSREDLSTTLPVVTDDRDLWPRILSDYSALFDVSTIQTQNIEPTFDITKQATIFSRGNLSTTPPFLMDDSDLLPQLLPDSSAPLMNETQSSYLSPTPAQMIPEGANSSIQDQDMMAMGCFTQWDNPEIFQQNTDFNGLNDQPFSYAALLEQNPVDARVGIDTEIPYGQFMTNQIFSSSPLQNYDISPHTAWYSQGPQHNQFYASNAYDLSYAHNSSASFRLPQEFTPLLQQDGHDSGIQTILDGQSQQSVLPVCQNYPWSEPYVQPTLVPVPPNLFYHQNANSPMLFEPPFPSGYEYDNQNNQYDLQAMIPNGHVEQGVGGFMRLSGGSLPVLDQRNDVFNQLLDTLNLQGLSPRVHNPTTLSSSLTSSQLVNSQAFSSNVSESAGLLRPERVQLQQLVAPIFADRVTIPYAPARRGRPRKRLEFGESSSSVRPRKLMNIAPSGTENGGTTPTSREANKSPENGNQNTNPANLSSAPSTRGLIINSMYSPAFERNGLSTDPHIRLFKPDLRNMKRNN